MKIAPIVLFVYNRPFHTERVIQALQKNFLASESDLYVFADGAKENESPDSVTRIHEVRKLINKIHGFNSVTVYESKINQGLSVSITAGINRVLENHDRIIVFEDDIIAHPNFLSFCNQALDIYEADENVFAISGYSFPLKGKLSSTYFLRTGAVWGWGTWKRSWKYFTMDSGRLLLEIESTGRKSEFDFNDNYPFYELLKKHHEGKVSSWDVCWYATIFLKNGLTLYPGKSLTENIGMDGTGTHYSKSQSNGNTGKNRRATWTEEKSAIQFTHNIQVDPIAQKKLMNYFNSQDKPNLFSRFRSKLKQKIFISQ